MRFTFRRCRPFFSFTWERWPTPSPSEVCWGTPRRTCRSDPVWKLWNNCADPPFDKSVQNLRPRCAQGVLESFLGTAIAGGVFCLLAGQPLIILSSTGPVLVFERLLFNFSRCVPILDAILNLRVLFVLPCRPFSNRCSLPSENTNSTTWSSAFGSACGRRSSAWCSSPPTPVSWWSISPVSPRKASPASSASSSSTTPLRRWSS